MISSAAFERQFLDEKKGKGKFCYLHVIAITLLSRVFRYFSIRYRKGRQIFLVLIDSRNQRGTSVANCVYFYELRAGEFRALRKMVLMK